MCAGRIKELVITAGGENVAPWPIEQGVLRALPDLLSNALLVGDQRKFLSLLLTLKTDIDTDTLLPTNGLTAQTQLFLRTVLPALLTPIKTVDDFMNAPPAIRTQLDSILQSAVDGVNERAASRAQRVQYWKVLPRDFSVGGGELGPTLKLRRPIVLKQYKSLIDQLYLSAETSGNGKGNGD